MIYPYQCKTCHANFTIDLSVEVYDKLRDKVSCPICKSKSTKRIFLSDGVYVQFKGDGFTKSVKEE